MRTLELYLFNVKLILSFSYVNIWDKVYKNRLSKNCGKLPLKKLKGCGLLKQIISHQIFKGYLPQILLTPFLNTLSHIILTSHSMCKANN